MFKLMHRWIQIYANNQSMFFEDFKNAYIKLVNSGARWKSLWHAFFVS